MPEALGKSQCKSCGLVQRTEVDFLAEGKFYEENYTTYFDRLGAESYEKDRYAATTKWMLDAIGNPDINSVIDAGCGRGWTLRALGTLLPKASLSGIEPSKENADFGTAEGFNIINAKAEEAVGKLEAADLVFCNNVIQHTADPAAFMNSLKKLAKPGGLIVITCPDGSMPANDMMWCDQNFSFAPEHLAKLAASAGLIALKWQKAPEDAPTLIDKQLIVLSSQENSLASDRNFKLLEIPKNIKLRDAYVYNWNTLDSFLCSEIEKYGTVFNFGASVWSYLLRGYCPSYWEQVQACTIDDFSGEFMDKKVIQFDTKAFPKDAVLVLGVSPTFQKVLTERFKSSELKTISWSNFIDR